MAMKIKVITPFQGSVNGFEIQSFPKAAVLDLEDSTAQLFIATGCCELVDPKKKSSDSNGD